MREDARTRGRRLVAEGRLLVTILDDDVLEAICRGDSGSYHLLGWREGRWRCSCEAKTTCAHLRALQLVTVAPRARENGER